MNSWSVRPGEDWRLETGVFEDKISRDVYLVQRNLWGELAGEVCPVCLFLAVNRQGDVFLSANEAAGGRGSYKCLERLCLGRRPAGGNTLGAGCGEHKGWPECTTRVEAASELSGPGVARAVVQRRF